MDHPEFGRYLARQRELRGMSQREVAERTKIPQSVLVALEAGQVERLPARVFVLNYVRAYARAIGIEPDEAVLRYEEIFTGAHTALSPVELERRRRGRAWRILLTLVLVAGAAAAAFWWLQQRQG